MQERKHDRDGAKSAEDATDAKGVGDGLAEAVLAWDIEIEQGCVVHPDLHGIDDVLGPADGITLVEAGFDGGRGADLRDEALDSLPGRLEADRVNIHQGEGGPGKFWETQDVHHEAPGPDNTASADECDLHEIPFRRREDVLGQPSDQATFPAALR